MELTDKTTYILKSFLLLLDILRKGQDVLGSTVKVVVTLKSIAVQLWVCSKGEEKDLCAKIGDGCFIQWWLTHKKCLKRGHKNDSGILKIGEKEWDFIAFIFFLFL